MQYIDRQIESQKAYFILSTKAVNEKIKSQFMQIPSFQISASLHLGFFVTIKVKKLWQLWINHIFFISGLISKQTNMEDNKYKYKIRNTSNVDKW